MIKIYWTTTTTTERQAGITVEDLLAAIAESGQEVPPRETDEEYVERVMDEVDMDEVLPFLEGHPAAEIVSEDIERSFDVWEMEE